MTKIRPITCYDIDDVQLLASDPLIADTANLPSPYPSDGAATWFERISKGITDGRQVVFAVTEGKTFVGVMSLNAINMSGRCCALDYWIGSPYWGQGHATKAAASAISYAANVLDLTRITSGCLQSNIGSKRVLEKSGFIFISETEYEGPFRDRFGSMKMLAYSLEINPQSPQ